MHCSASHHQKPGKRSKRTNLKKKKEYVEDEVQANENLLRKKDTPRFGSPRIAANDERSGCESQHQNPVANWLGREQHGSGHYVGAVAGYATRHALCGYCTQLLCSVATGPAANRRRLAAGLGTGRRVQPATDTCTARHPPASSDRGGDRTAVRSTHTTVSVSRCRCRVDQRWSNSNTVRIWPAYCPPRGNRMSGTR